MDTGISFGDRRFQMACRNSRFGKFCSKGVNSPNPNHCQTGSRKSPDPNQCGFKVLHVDPATRTMTTVFQSGLRGVPEDTIFLDVAAWTENATAGRLFTLQGTKKDMCLNNVDFKIDGFYGTGKPGGGVYTNNNFKPCKAAGGLKFSIRATSISYNQTNSTWTSSDWPSSHSFNGLDRSNTVPSLAADRTGVFVLMEKQLLRLTYDSRGFKVAMQIKDEVLLGMPTNVDLNRNLDKLRMGSQITLDRDKEGNAIRAFVGTTTGKLLTVDLKTATMHELLNMEPGRVVRGLALQSYLIPKESASQSADLRQVRVFVTLGYPQWMSGGTEQLTVLRINMNAVDKQKKGALKWDEWKDFSKTILVTLRARAHTHMHMRTHSALHVDLLV